MNDALVGWAILLGGIGALLLLIWAATAPLRALARRRAARDQARQSALEAQQRADALERLQDLYEEGLLKLAEYRAGRIAIVMNDDFELPTRLIDGHLKLLLAGLDDEDWQAVKRPLLKPAPEKAEKGPTPRASKDKPVGPACPECGGPMVRRIAGDWARPEFRGKPFWGCRSHPRCDGIVPI